jgi:hypothetical protein
VITPIVQQVTDVLGSVVPTIPNPPGPPAPPAAGDVAKVVTPVVQQAIDVLGSVVPTIQNPPPPPSAGGALSLHQRSPQPPAGTGAVPAYVHGSGSTVAYIGLNPSGPANLSTPAARAAVLASTGRAIASILARILDAVTPIGRVLGAISLADLAHAGASAPPLPRPMDGPAPTSGFSASGTSSTFLFFAGAGALLLLLAWTIPRPTRQRIAAPALWRPVTFTSLLERPG